MATIARRLIAFFFVPSASVKIVAFRQSRAAQAGADPLGYYVAPLAYAQLQVVEQAVRAVGSLDDAALSDYTRTASFETVVGKVTFGEGGGWAQPRVLTVQFQNMAR